MTAQLEARVRALEAALAVAVIPLETLRRDAEALPQARLLAPRLYEQIDRAVVAGREVLAAVDKEAADG